MTHYLRALAAKLRGLFGDRGADRELDDEIETHLRLLTERYVRQGMSETEAARAARRQFGNVTMLQEAHRDMRGIRFIDTLFQDLRFGARALFKKPGFTLVVISTLALGIGANTAIFSLFNGLILKPPPYREPDRLVNLRVSPQRGMRYQAGADANFSTASPGGFHEWRARSRSFEGMTAYRPNSTIFADREQSLYVVTLRAAEHFFEIHGVNALLGRAFASQDYDAAAQKVIILSHDLWSLQYGADPHVIGRTIRLDGVPHIVIGVMPSGFRPDAWSFPRVWVPYFFNAEEQSDRKAGRWNVIARLRHGVSIDQAQAEMDLLAAQLNADYPEDYKGRGIVLIPVEAEFSASLRSIGWIFVLLLCAVGLVLLIACVNVANLLLAQAMERELEFAVRAAIGASGGRLVRQLLTESCLLALIGGGIGLLLGAGCMRLLAAFLAKTAPIPRLDELHFDWQAFAFTAAISLLTGLLFGLVPALRVAHPNLQQTLNEEGRSNAASARRRRLGNLLVTGEVALALLLTIGAGLIVQSFIRLQRVDPGFKASRLLTMYVNVPDYKYGRFTEDSLPGSPEVESRIKLYPNIEERISALSGVESAAVASRLPILDGPEQIAINIAGRSGEAPASLIDNMEACQNLRLKTGLACHGTVGINSVTSGYFRTLGIRLLRGRLFDGRDREDTPLVAVISQTTADRYWPGEDPIGHRLTLNYPNRAPQFEILGVVSDIKTDDLYKPLHPEIYQLMSQQPSDDGQLIIRTKAAPESLAKPVREEMARFDHDMPVRNVTTMENIITYTLGRTRLAAWLLGLFAALAVTLAVAGLYGIMSYAVNQRTSEIGLRMALGATTTDVLRMVIGEGSRVILVGLILGLAAAYTFNRLLVSLLFGITATDPLSYAGAVVALGLTALLACYLPARKATKVDPLLALRRT